MLAMGFFLMSVENGQKLLRDGHTGPMHESARRLSLLC